ncbi:MAG TPA: TOPRIM nucleotidyl transferase/hydrolase domain-containing protein [Galbitalea sp.]|jgi:hypothetical protein|nr:TOPRIM nucleotidyl transferase/hydrolase domain-containing protein [Galbitalea sp.]
MLPRDLERVDNAATVVLVEGVSDAAAVRSTALVLGLDLEAERVHVVQAGGVTNFRKFLVDLGPRGRRMRLAGLCDAPEERHLVRALEAAGLGRPDDRESMARMGFFVCSRDLEDELIRALGTDRVLDILDRNGDLERFRTFQRQPAKRDEPIDRQLHRFFGTTSGRKERYGRILAGRLNPENIPSSLASLIDFVVRP